MKTMLNAMIRDSNIGEVFLPHHTQHYLGTNKPTLASRVDSLE